MLPHNSRIVTETVLLCTVIACILVGCSDSPENKAAKELRQMTEAALQLIEKGPGLDDSGVSDPLQLYVEARGRLQSALAKANLAPRAAEPARLAHGNLCFAQVRHMRNATHQLNTPVSDVVDELTVIARKIADLRLRQEELRQAVDAIETETRQLTDLLEGTADKQGLRAKLADAQARLQDLTAQRAARAAEQQAAQDNAALIQHQADEKLQAAQLTTGEEKMTLLNAAFELMRQKKDPMTKAQEAADQIEILDEKIVLLQPEVNQLTRQVDATAKRIEHLKTSGDREKIQSGITEADEQIQKHNARVDWLVADLKKGLDACAKHVADMTELLDTAIADYRKITGSLRDTAAARAADASFWKASVAADRFAFNQHISTRLQAIAAAELGPVSATLNEVAAQYFEIPEDQAKSILASFDQAITHYTDSPASGKAAKDIMAGHVLTLYGKALFAERLGDYDTADAAVEAADEVLAKIKQLDPVFFTSVTAQLLNPSADFIPPMSVDLTATYEEFKKQFQPWKQMRGEQKKAEVERLLALLDSMKPPLDPEEFNRIIGPERQALEAQLAKGFDEPATSTDPNYP
ncbi:MAG TPA: hypothetical protein P5279_12345 [Anaerohalosphaeraceae bacterium]|nr:hypothetical protein [Anaerohalosphaeraceae bacterium]HRT51280.1 hypothetical protein [Anaerohalosphaeraceae bacterium]HRT88137.1 hypothetical protein [Anaerohalosphaeraceae bacterium]